jgi:hypothetical protein
MTAPLGMTAPPGMTARPDDAEAIPMAHEE